MNALPLAPEGTTSGMGYLQYRVYLPAGGDFSKLTPPALTLEQGGRTESLGACATSTSLPTAPRPAPSAGQTATPATPTPAPQRAIPQLTFFQAAFDGASPNVDTAYVLAYLVPPGADDVAVIRAKAATHATGDDPSSWPGPVEDVRYWSMCIGLAT